MSILVEPFAPAPAAAELFRRFSGEPGLAFLDSNRGYGELGRWSILACRPWLSLRGWPDYCLLNGRRIEQDPFSLLRGLLAEQKTAPIAGLPLVGGCIGAIAYDAGFALNDLPLPPRVDRSQPVVRFDFYDNLVLLDHRQDRAWLMACGRLEPAESGLARLRNRLVNPGLARSEPGAAGAGSGRAAGGRLLHVPPREPYLAKVEQLRQWIRQGEVYIANLTARFLAVSPLASAELYRRFRQVNPAPFAAFIRQDDFEILSASPERFLEIRPADGDWRIETRPIKGTRPRSPDPAIDQANRQELADSGKDRSELLMIVDLERNDLSRICRPDSVRVDALFALETFPEVFHLVATVSGLLRRGVDAVACLEACFPGGSITGAPKMRAMELIENLEDDARGFYTGCLGYLSADGQADFSIIIRTMVRRNGLIQYGSGGGITWESNPAAEYQEILDKAAFFRRLIEDDSNR